MIQQTSDLIESFIADYAGQLNKYEDLARELGRCCKKLCDDFDIKAIISFRAKKPDRLREKIYKAEEKRGSAFETKGEVWTEMADICGARIALYLPNQRDKANHLVRESFSVMETRNHPEEGMEHKSGSFRGKNHRILFSTSGRSDFRAEVQVHSLMMHAWAEVEHDNFYKKMDGIPSEEEYDLSSNINRLVLVADSLTQRLQQMKRARPHNLTRPIEDKYELSDLIIDRWGSESLNWKESFYRLDELLWLLRQAESLTPNQIEPLLAGGICWNDARTTIAERVFLRRPDLILPYLERRLQNVGSRNKVLAAFGAFLSKWLIVERFIRAVSSEENREITLSVESLISASALDDNDKSMLKNCLISRRRVIHGIMPVFYHKFGDRDADNVSDFLTRMEASDDLAIIAAYQYAIKKE
jgi:ppGpp synthetase/RelA/SpoT-type nucleotidyltranferase